MTESHDDWAVQQSYDSNVPASEAVVKTVAAATNKDMMSLEPLQWTIDTDALNAMFERDQVDVDVSFTYDACRVHMDPETIVVRPDVCE